MIGQHNPVVNMKCPRPAHITHRISQDIDLLYQQCIAMMLKKIHSKKITPAGDAVTTIIGQALLPCHSVL